MKRLQDNTIRALDTIAPLHIRYYLGTQKMPLEKWRDNCDGTMTLLCKYSYDSAIKLLKSEIMATKNQLSFLSAALKHERELIAGSDR